MSITKTMARQTAGLLKGQTDNRSGSGDITSPPFPFSLPLFLSSFLPSPLPSVPPFLPPFLHPSFSVSSGILSGLLFLIASPISPFLCYLPLSSQLLCTLLPLTPCCPGSVVLGQPHTLKVNLFHSFRMKKQHNSKYCDKYLFCSYQSFIFTCTWYKFFDHWIFVLVSSLTARVKTTQGRKGLPWPTV